jgi:hypothetical protein
MTLGEFYRAAVRVGMAADPRGEDALNLQMQRLAQQYEEMSERDRRLFDSERLSNPFGDTRIAYGDPDTELGRVVIGIDIGSSELLLAAELGRRGKQVDAVMSHHASAIAGALASRRDTAIPQVWMAMKAGMPEPRVWYMLDKLIGRDEPSWNLAALQVAEALEIPLLGVHTPADLCMDELVRTNVTDDKPETVGELLELFEAWPECQWLIDKARHAPHLDAGDARAPLGKVYAVCFGGWNPTPTLFEELCKAGVGTFVVVASTKEFQELANKYGAAVIVIPHYPADNAGINIMLDRIMPSGDEFDIIETSNFVRIRRPG